MELFQILLINSGFIVELKFILLLDNFDPFDFFYVFRGHVRLEIFSL